MATICHNHVSTSASRLPVPPQVSALRLLLGLSQCTCRQRGPMNSSVRWIPSSSQILCSVTISGIPSIIFRLAARSHPSALLVLTRGLADAMALVQPYPIKPDKTTISCSSLMHLCILQRFSPAKNRWQKKTVVSLAFPASPRSQQPGCLRREPSALLLFSLECSWIDTEGKLAC